MNVHLIFAPTNYALNVGDLGKAQDPPLGILYVAAYLREHMPGVGLTATDGILEGYDATLSKALEVDADVIGISTVTHNTLGAYRLADAIRAVRPEVKIIFGGPHCSAFPEEPLIRSVADVVVVGEGEVTFLELMHLYAAGGGSPEDLAGIDGLCFMRDGEPVQTGARQFIRDLDTIPFPARDLVNMADYKGWMLSKTGHSTAIFVSRGCPYKCTYCSNNIWRCSKPGYRSRSAENVIAELRELKDRYGITEFFDNSDEFNTQLEQSKDMLRKIIDAKLDIRFQCQVRAWPMDDELAGLMREAGVWYLHLGIESGNQTTLDGIRKKITLQQVEDCCRILKKHGIKIWGLFMYFNIWERDGKLFFEDYEDSKNTLRYARSLYKRKLIDFFGGTITTPVPGSELWDIAERHGLLKSEYHGNWDLWFYKREARLVSSLPGVTEEDVFRLHQKTVKYTAMALIKQGLINPANLRITALRGLYALKRQAVVLVKTAARAIGLGGRPDGSANR